MPQRSEAGWAVGQCSADNGERVSASICGTTVLLTVAAATQFATALLIAAKNVEAVNAADEDEDASDPIPLPSTP